MPIINEPRVREAGSLAQSEDVATRATAAEREGSWETAAELYALTFRSAVVDGELERAADALRGQARMLLQLRRAGEAEELAVLSLELARANGLRHTLARALNILGIIRYSERDWDAAEEFYEQSLAIALEMGEDELVGLTCLNLGVLANLRGEYQEARSRYLEGIGSFVRTGSAANAMLAYNNLGIASVDLHEWMEAEIYFTRGIEIAERLRQVPAAGMLYSNLSEPLIQVGELERARSSLEMAEAAAEQVHDRSTLADVARFRGMLALKEGDWEAADEQLTRAVELAADPALQMERAKALRASAELQMLKGARGEALKMLADAAEIFRSLRMPVDERAALARMTDAVEFVG